MKIYKPTSSGTRHRIVTNRKLLDTVDTCNNLININKASSGHNSLGRITVKHKCKGNKTYYRKVNPLVYNYLPFIIKTIEYNPKSTNYINKLSCLGLIVKYYPFILGINRGAIIYIDSDRVGLSNLGSSYKLLDIPLNKSFSNYYTTYSLKYKTCTSAGAYSIKLKEQDAKYSIVELKSGKSRLLANKNLGIYGPCGNVFNNKKSLGKAGISHYLGVRPKVRGVAMNPVDHPHGGGEGKSSGGRPSISYSGVLSKGKKTRKSKKYSNKCIYIKK